VAFFPIACDACSANPPLQKCYDDSFERTDELTLDIESPCRRQPFEGSPPNLFEQHSRMAWRAVRHSAPESILGRLPFPPVSTNLLRAR